MDDHFDTSGVFEISNFDILKWACIPAVCVFCGFLGIFVMVVNSTLLLLLQPFRELQTDRLNQTKKSPNFLCYFFLLFCILFIQFTDDH